MLKAYEAFGKYDRDGAVRLSINEDRIDLINEWYKKATVLDSHGVAQEWKPWHDEIEDLHEAMESYLALKNNPHSTEEVLQDIQTTIATHVRGKKR